MSRSTFYIVVIVFILLAGSLAYHFWPHKAPAMSYTNYPSKGTDLIAFGDSLVAGYGANDGQDFVSDLSANIGQPIINLGVDGDTTAEALARISSLDKYNPKVVILLVGGNDYLQQKDMTQAFINLGKIISYIQSKGAVVVLVGVRASPLIGNFDSQYQQLVKQYNVAYVPDAMDGIIGNSKYMFDSVHPNSAGYALLAGRILPTLNSVLK
ncbi:MAG TPA: GDSL-type esterase/lipase family protein [Candidatus Paceibacterota bacterium]|nr:GDSL-type esterase/lipase family protein [Candidatus Paceibacterota bacterium]